MGIGRHERGNCLDGFPQNFNHTFEFRNRGAEGWDEDDDVADGAEEEATPADFHRDVVADSGCERKRRFCCSILHQFDTCHESLLTNVADVLQL
jgi:hypothetical protein